jgi:hypothetical protein
MDGHQPELFHPGVWLKNFVLAGLARAHNALALHLVVDNDTIKSTSLRMPGGEPIPFDRWTGEQPWEERALHDPDLFASFPQRLRAALAPWNIAPLAEPLWAALPTTGPLGERFSVARRSLERAWGCANVELPLSRVCETPSFQHFVTQLEHDAPHFAAVYNAAVRSYRQRNKIKSRNHPVPDLEQQGDWTELPLWTWDPGAKQRERLFVRPNGDRRPKRARVRSRALLTTLYARLYLADVFVHGIGGGIYDELTDEIILNYYGVTPPGYMVVSGTRLLPLPRSGVDRDDWRRVWRRVRDLTYQPERFVGPEMAQLIAERKAVLAEPPSRAMFARQRKLLEQIARPLAEQRAAARRELQHIEATLARESRLHRRDYSLALFPEELLRPWLTAWLNWE